MDSAGRRDEDASRYPLDGKWVPSLLVGALSATMLLLAALEVMRVVPRIDSSWALRLFFATPFVAVAMTWLVHRRWMSWLVIGSEGLVVERRAISHAQVEGARCVRHALRAPSPEVEWSVAIDLKSGETVVVDAGSAAAAETVAGAVERARDAYRTPSKHAHDRALEVVARGGRSGAEWLERLRRLVSTQTTAYRDDHVEPEQLTRLLDDPAVTPSARAAAAIALLSAGDGTAATRLRVVARSIAAPRLRIALESVANDSERAAEALELLEAEDRERAPKNAIGGHLSDRRSRARERT